MRKIQIINRKTYLTEYIYIVLSDLVFYLTQLKKQSKSSIKRNEQCVRSVVKACDLHWEGGEGGGKARLRVLKQDKGLRKLHNLYFILVGTGRT